MRVRSGTQALKGSNKVLVKTSGRGGLRRMQCPRCNKTVNPSQDGQGRPVYKCKCGATFASRPM